MDFPLPSWPSQVSLKGMIITKAGDLSVEQVPQMHLGVCQNFKPEGPQDTTACFYPCIYPLVNIQKTIENGPFIVDLPN